MRKILCIVLLLVFVTGCTNNNKNKDVIYEDMKESFENSNLLSSNIGLFSKVEEDGKITYGECGSGVIFKRVNDTYYALTAKHVVSTKNATILVFTTNTDMTNESLPGMDDTNVLDESVYDSMIEADIEYASDENDLAIVSFKSSENLSVVELADKDPEIGDKIMCIGNPQNDWFAISYGKITSGLETFGELKGYPSNAMKHSAYIQVGSSGGAALNEEMKLVGITPGGAFSLNGKNFKYGVIIPVSEIKESLEEWEKDI